MKTSIISSPFISIIIPTYNVAPFMRRCLNSCINQTLSDIEILIIDDCGSDESIDIASEYARYDKRIRIIHNPRNLGLFHTRIVGELEARGRYILPLDGDDYLHLRTCKILFQKICNASLPLQTLSLVKNLVARMGGGGGAK